MSHQPHYTPAPHDEPDSWHRHIPAQEGLPQEEHGEDTKPLALTVAFLLCFVFVAGTILASYLYFRVHMTSLRQQRIETTTFAEQFNQSRNAELARLKDYSFASDDKARAGRASLPIEEAKKQVIARYAK